MRRKCIAAFAAQLTTLDVKHLSNQLSPRGLPCVQAAFVIKVPDNLQVVTVKVIIEYLGRRSRATLILMGLVLVIYIGELDYVTGPMIALTIFYAVPICFVSWFAGRWPGMAIGLVSALIWYAAKYLDPGYIDDHLGLLWNGTQRLGMFVLLAVLTAEVAERKKVEQVLRASQEGLESRVREREQLLKRNFERLRESERVKVEAQERQRIMQDMHDGLGSQLMSSLMLVERGAVSNDQFAQILRESIDDMRLAIDALAADDADLAAALGNLRFRMEPRLRAAGMELTWDARRLPEELGLHPDVVLPILRIVQEALTNALKHSRARAVRLAECARERSRTLGSKGSKALDHEASKHCPLQGRSCTCFTSGRTPDGRGKKAAGSLSSSGAPYIARTAARRSMRSS